MLKDVLNHVQLQFHNHQLFSQRLLQLAFLVMVETMVQFQQAMVVELHLTHILGLTEHLLQTSTT